MEDGLIDSELNETPKDVILGIMRWWEKKRLLFNGIICGIALIALIQSVVSGSMMHLLDFSIVIHSIFYLIFINCCYCVGWGLQLLRFYYFNVQPDSHTVDYALFVIGTLFTGIVTYFGFLVYLMYR